MGQRFRVQFFGGPWHGRVDVMTAPLLNSLDARSPEPTSVMPMLGEPVDVMYTWRDTVYERHVDPDKPAGGVELDGLVNERVLGNGPGQAPRFSASPAAAAQLESRLAARGWKRPDKTVRPGPGAALPILVQLVNESEDLSVDALGQTFEEALCKAALKAVEP